MFTGGSFVALVVRSLFTVPVLGNGAIDLLLCLARPRRGGGISHGFEVGLQIFIASLIALTFFGVGALILFASDAARLRSALARPVVSLAALRPGRRARARGVASPASTPIHRSPVSGRPSIAHLIRAAHGKNGHSVVERQSGEFWLDDGSGTRVRVRTQGAALFLVEDWFMETERIVIAPSVRMHIGLPSETERAWVAARLPNARSLRRVEEARIEPGQALQIVGRPKRDGEGLYFEAQGADRVDLLDGDDSLLRGRLDMSRGMGLAFVGTGALVVVGLVLWLVLS